jgi:type III pantothenate kinase
MSPSIRIDLISEHASPLAVLGSTDAGGQNVHVAELARHVAALGAHVTVHTRRDDPALPAIVPFAPNVEVHHVDAGPAHPVPKDDLLPYMDAFADVLRACWSRHRPDVVHSHFWMSGLATMQASRDLGIPWAHTYHALGAVKRRHQGSHDTSPPERIDIETQIAREADLVVATSYDECRELREMGALRRRLVRVPCGVDLSIFTPSGPSMPRDPDRRRIAVVGRLIERKGIGNVIEALAFLPTDVELVIAGGPPHGLLDDDPAAKHYRQHAAELGVTDRVDLLGALDRHDVARLMRSADVVCCCPWYEPFGLVAVEAMACGVPVVATRVGGLAETIVDGRTGLHVAPREPADIARAIGSLLDDQPHARQLGRAGACRARRFGWQDVAARTLLQLERLAATQPSRTALASRTSFAALARSATPACCDAAMAQSGMRARPRHTSADIGSDALSTSWAVNGGRAHLARVRDALALVEPELARIELWAATCALRLRTGNKLLAAGNGGSAAHAQHLTAELVGRYRADRPPMPAFVLHGDASAVTAIINDFGADELFRRQVLAFAAPGDVFFAFSTSGRSPNLLHAAAAARDLGALTLALTGAAPNPLIELCDDHISVPTSDTPAVQEIHQVLLHLFCDAIDHALMDTKVAS